MSDLISRLSEIRSQYNCFNESEEPYYRALSEVIKMLSEQPEIIRCKDCKYHDEGYRRISVKWLPCIDMRLGSNWYCADAERSKYGSLYKLR